MTRYAFKAWRSSLRLSFYATLWLLGSLTKWKVR